MEELLNISDMLGGEKKKYYVLSYKRRDTYFQSNSDAIRFLKIKFRRYPGNSKDSGFLKHLVYLLIKLRFMQLFLKKIELSSEMGDVIFRGGQVKCFDLKKNVVTSFPLIDQEGFLESKEDQEDAAKKGFAPKIIELDKKFPFSKEELLEEYDWKNDFGVFKKLLSYYEKNKLEKVSLEKYLKSLTKELGKIGLKSKELKEILEKVSKKYDKKTVLRTAIVHGDFAREQVLVKNGQFVFVDWNSEEDLITRDLVTRFFRGIVDLQKNKKFLEILSLYPKDVQENIQLYIILNEASLMISRGKISEFSMKRIANLI